MDYDPRFLSRGGSVLPGEKRLVTIPQPAAGADWSITVPGNRQWQVVGGMTQLLTSSVAGSRYPSIGMSDGTTQWWRSASGSAESANQAYLYTIAQDSAPISQAATVSPFVLGLPQVYLPPGTVIFSQTVGLLSGDQWAGGPLMVEEVWADDQALSERHYERENAIMQALASSGYLTTPGA